MSWYKPWFSPHGKKSLSGAKYESWWSGNRDSGSPKLHILMLKQLYDFFFFCHETKDSHAPGHFPSTLVSGRKAGKLLSDGVLSCGLAKAGGLLG